MKIIAISIISLLTIISCNTSKTVVNNKGLQSTDTYFSMYRSGCYGNCPVYKVTIQKDGNIAYFGKSNVKNIGEKSDKLSAEQVTNLFEMLSKYEWETYLEEYPIDNVDFPGFYLEYANGKLLRKVQGNSNSPKELQELTLKIDALLQGMGY